MIAVIDYGAGNIGSVLNMLKKLAVPASRASTPEAIHAADALILPGVGAFDFCMNAFQASGLRDAVEQSVFEQKKPLLGICVGFQMMFANSEEGVAPGLGWLKGHVARFKKDQMPANFKIPHMGWNSVHPAKPDTLFNGIESPRFYFVHSYHAICENPDNVYATANYGYDFCCAAGRDNIQGVQFHPEKSHKFGQQLLKNFSNLVNAR